MLNESVDTVIVGGGQAGIAMSEHLSHYGIDHVILERNRIAERWRSERWDTLVANGPAWHDRFPTLAFNSDPNGFPNKQEIADYFERYAQHIKAPVRCNVNVENVRRIPGQAKFEITTNEGVLESKNLVAATGPFQTPVIPKLLPDSLPELPELKQLHSRDYKNPEQLPNGAVLVIGAGSSGTQIADELNRSGRTVFLSVGAHDRPPRSYRGRDFVWWLGVLGKWDAATVDPGTAHVTIAVSGARGGATVDFRRLAHEGITLTGMSTSYERGVLSFASDLAQNIQNGDKNYLSLLDEADAYVERLGLTLPEEPDARKFPSEPTCLLNPLQELDLLEHNVSSIIWATGYKGDYDWLNLDVFEEDGRPKHQRGVTAEPGFYFLGLPWQSRRGSAFIWGVWHDAKHLADQINIQHQYSAYHNAMNASKSQS